MLDLVVVSIHFLDWHHHSLLNVFNVFLLVRHHLHSSLFGGRGRSNCLLYHFTDRRAFLRSCDKLIIRDSCCSLSRLTLLNGSILRGKGGNELVIGNRGWRLDWLGLANVGKLRRLGYSLSLCSINGGGRVWRGSNSLVLVGTFDICNNFVKRDWVVVGWRRVWSEVRARSELGWHRSISYDKKIKTIICKRINLSEKWKIEAMNICLLMKQR